MKSSSMRRSRLYVEELEVRWVLSGVQPTAAEQLMLEQLNDIRSNPAAYGAAIGLDLSNVPPSQPLAFDPLLIDAARQHSQDMNDRAYFNHITPDGVDPGQRLTNVGFPWQSWGESAAAGSTYPDSGSALQSLITDSGVADLSHRVHLLALNGLYLTQNQVGIGIEQGGNGPLTNYYTIDTAATLDGRPFLTGSVFDDLNGDGHYGIGEGLAHVKITVSIGDQVLVNTTTFDSGGYSIRLNPGTYTITTSGGGLTTPVSQTATITTTNVRLNFALPPAGVQPDASAWIGLLYRDILGRVPTSGEVTSWTDGLASGTSPATVAHAFLASQEYTQDLVTQWYQQYLHRAPDSSGLAFFAQSLQHGASEDSVRLGILASPEYFRIQGGSITSFVTGLYQDLLGRTPNSQEASSWITRVSHGDRTGTIMGFLNSQEFHTDELTAYYNTILRRQPDQGGLNSFLGQLGHGTDESAVLQVFYSSPEYTHEAHNIIWVESVYQDVLGRSPGSVSEIGFWLGQLNNGFDRASIAGAILMSDEARTRVVNGLYQSLLGRAPTAAELSQASQLLQTDGHAATIIDQLASSQEYFDRQQNNRFPFIRGLFRDLLKRGASDPEVLLWLNKLNQGETQAQLVTEFTSQPEYLQDSVNSLFMTYLHRSPTAAESSQFIGQIQAGATDATLASQLIGSDEYFLAFMS